MDRTGVKRFKRGKGRTACSAREVVGSSCTMRENYRLVARLLVREPAFQRTWATATRASKDHYIWRQICALRAFRRCFLSKERISIRIRTSLQPFRKVLKLAKIVSRFRLRFFLPGWRENASTRIWISDHLWVPKNWNWVLFPCSVPFKNKSKGFWERTKQFSNTHLLRFLMTYLKHRFWRNLNQNSLFSRNREHIFHFEGDVYSQSPLNFPKMYWKIMRCSRSASQNESLKKSSVFDIENSRIDGKVRRIPFPS